MIYNLLSIASEYPLIKYFIIAFTIFVIAYWWFKYFHLENSKEFRIKFSSTLAIAFTTLILAYSQLEHIQREINSNTFNAMNAWYNNLYKEFPTVFSNKSSKKEKRNLARRYFNLWQNELIHCKKNSMDKEFMDIINHGACKNMILYPDLVVQYKFWVKNNAFHRSNQLKQQISKVIYYAERNKCEEIPKTQSCLIK